VANGAILAKAPARSPSAKPLVFYGSSIAQGGCASRPGMAYPAILGRRLDRATVNLGFSGCGKLEPPMADLLAELDSAAFVIECWPNIPAVTIAERFGPFVGTIAKAHPGTPIVILEEPDDPSAESEKNRVLRRGVGALRAEGLRDIRLVSGRQQLGPDGEGTVDGCHPTDLGFVRMADAIEPVLRDVLKGR
jgi:lysophospholipase L1-like esterase